MVGTEGGDDFDQHVEALDQDIRQLRASLSPKEAKPNSVVNTIVQMGLAIGRITQPLQHGPVRTPEQEAGAQKAMLVPGLVIMGLIGAGLLGGFLWRIEAGGGLAVDLLVGLAAALVGGLLVGTFGFVVAAVIKAASVMRRKDSPT